MKISQNIDKFEFRLSFDSNIYTSGTVKVIGINSAGDVDSLADLTVNFYIKKHKFK